MPVFARDTTTVAASTEGSSRLHLHNEQEQCVTVLFAWPTVRALTRTRGAFRWKIAQPEIPILPPPGEVPASPDALVWSRFLAGVPPEVRALVSPFSTGHWRLLGFAARCGKPAGTSQCRP